MTYSGASSVLSSAYLLLCRPDFPKRRAIYFNGIRQPSHLPYCVTPQHQLHFRNINRISIDYGFRPRLRDRVTLRRLT